MFAGVLLRITGAGVTVRGGIWDGNTTNQSAANNGIQVESNDVSLHDVTVQNAKFIGIYNTGGNRFLARGCKVSNTGYIGIFSEPNITTPAPYTGVVITDCIVDRSMIAGASIMEGGIKVKGMLTNTLTGARISGCLVRMPTSPIDGSAIAIEPTYAPGAVVSDNHTFGGAMGVSAAACDGAIVSANRVFAPDDYGIEIAAGLRNTVSGNTIDGNGLTGCGIMVNTASGVNSTATTVTSNTIRACTVTPLQVQQSPNCTIVGNTIENAAGNLITLVLSDGAAVVGNTLNGLGAAPKGLMVDTTSYVTVSGNVMRDCTQNAVFLY
ncbi:MAG TPA: right-handed parallel beta-helix repeat-containing protein, partial [Actinoplanes sp.]